MRPQLLLLALMGLGIGIGGCQLTTSPVLIPNSSPSIGLLLPEPDADGAPIPLDADEGLQFRAVVDDPEDVPEELRILWSAVRTDLGDTTLPLDLTETTPDTDGYSDFVLTGLDAGLWLVIAQVRDTEGATDEASMPVEVVGADSPPEVQIFAPSSGESFIAGDVVTFSATAGDDRGPDQLEAEWFDDLDGPLDSTPPSGAGLLTFSRSDLTIGEHLVTLTITDGSGLQAQASVDFVIESGNAPPSTPTVDLIPDDPTTNDDLTCLVTVASSDPELQPVTLIWSWYRDGSPTAWIDPVLTSDQTFPDETWTCEVYGNDGVLDSESGSDSVTIGNSPPYVDTVTLGPSPAVESSTLTCAGVGWEDPDDDPEDYDVVWLVNSTPIAAMGLTLDGSDFDRDDIVVCELTPWDGTVAGDPVESNAVLIENTAPTTPSVTLTPSPTAPAGSNLNCSATGSLDDDPLDSVLYDVTWLLDGAPAPAWDAIWTIPWASTGLGDIWTCQVTATDGIDVTVQVTKFTEVLPVPGDIVISEYMPKPEAVADAAGEWLELFNASGATLNLAGFELHDDGGDSFVVGTDLVIPAAARVVLARNEDPATNGGVIADLEYTGFVMDDSSDELVISFSGLEIDRVDYNWTGDLDGHSASLDPALGSPSAGLNDLQSNWCGSMIPLTSPGSDYGTPGSSNDTCDCYASDGDGDGFGDSFSCAWFDCNDTNASINPAAFDVCENGVDEDCSGADLLCDCLSTDGDGDGYGTGGACTQIDCDDSDSNINPGATEVCDFDDNDCDGAIDEGFDGDGDGWTSCEGDCDNSAVNVYPGAFESCNGIDDDCDGPVDEGYDGDGDGWSSCGGDCDNGDPTVYPGATDVCNDVDDDCDGSIDENAAGDAYEPNDSSSTAPTVLGNDASTSLSATMHLSTDNSDWYIISATDNTQFGCDTFYVSASMSSIPTGTDYDLYLYNGSLNLIDYSVEWNTTPESVSWSPGCLSPGNDGGSFYVRVVRYSGYDCGDSYNLSLSNGG